MAGRHLSRVTGGSWRNHLRNIHKILIPGTSDHRFTQSSCITILPKEGNRMNLKFCVTVGRWIKRTSSACQNLVDPLPFVAMPLVEPSLECAQCRDISTFSLVESVDTSWSRNTYRCDRCQALLVKCLTWLTGGYCNGFAASGKRVDRPFVPRVPLKRQRWDDPFKLVYYWAFGRSITKEVGRVCYREDLQWNLASLVFLADSCGSLRMWLRKFLQIVLCIYRTMHKGSKDLIVPKHDWLKMFIWIAMTIEKFSL